MGKLLFLGLIFLTFRAFGQAPTDFGSYLRNEHVSTEAKEFYNGKFKTDDGDKTFSIIDSINTQNNLTRPFYLYLVSKMMNKSDGALSEGLGNATKDFFEKSPDKVIDFLYSNNKMVAPHFRSSWAQAIAGEFMIICEGREKECSKRSLQQALTKTKKENRPRIIQFYKLIESHYH